MTEPSESPDSAAYDRTMSSLPSGKQYVDTYMSWVPKLPVLSLRDDPDDAIPLVDEGIIGTGGMGAIHIAKQMSMGRRVAVKMLKDGKSSVERRAKLLSEAWVIGHLSHPNIVPIHVVGRTEDGAPLLVMKRVEGVAWRNLIRNPSLASKMSVTGDALDLHIDTLMRVCDALTFAHSRHIIHRDVKPSNVMLGDYGEVYLLDWGVAVRAGNDGPSHIPRVVDTPGVAGTAAYLAPEMAHARIESIGPLSDVFLLGTCLYEVTMGTPPHVGRSLAEVLERARSFTEPRLSDDIPYELAEIIRTAMSYHPADRYSSPEAMRQHLAAFKKHRSSRAVAAEALDSVRRLREIARDGPRNEETAAKVHAAFYQARYGLLHALEIWPQNREAERALQRAHESAASFELDRGAFDPASMYVSWMPVVPAKFEDRLEALGAQLSDKQDTIAVLTQRRRELDSSVGASRRARDMFAVAMVWVATFSVCRFAGVFGELSIASVLCIAAASTAGTLFELVLVRGWPKTEHNLRVALAAAIAMIFVVAGQALAWRLGADQPLGFLIGMIAGGAVCAAVGVVIDIGFLAVAGTIILATIVAAALPGFGLGITIASIVLGSALMAAVWHSKESDGQA